MSGSDWDRLGRDGRRVVGYSWVWLGQIGGGWMLFRKVHTAFFIVSSLLNGNFKKVWDMTGHVDIDRRKINRTPGSN